MSLNDAIPYLVAVAAVLGGFYGGRQTGRMQDQAIEALKTTVEEQQRRLATIPDLHGRILVLEDLVTQRANVDRVIEIVEDLQEKINAAPWLT